MSNFTTLEPSGDMVFSLSLPQCGAHMHWAWAFRGRDYIYPASSAIRHNSSYRICPCIWIRLLLPYTVLRYIQAVSTQPSADAWIFDTSEVVQYVCRYKLKIEYKAAQSII